MKRFKVVIKSSFLAGIGVILPIVLMLFLLEKLTTMTGKITSPLAESIFPEQFYLRSVATEMVTFILLLMVAFILGVIANTRFGLWFGDWVENRTLMHLPIYRTLKEFSKRLVPSEHNVLFEPALLTRKDEMPTLVFVVEHIVQGYVVIFIPSAPAAFTGSIQIVLRTDVEMLHVPVMDVVKAYSYWGVGTAKILEKSMFLHRPLPNNLRERSFDN
jgi:uncharacterized membrane protein